MQIEKKQTFEESETILELQPGQIAMFGYGSLLFQHSMEATLGFPYVYPCIPCSLVGWRRSYDVFMPNKSFYEPLEEGAEFVPQHIVYLNVRQSAQDIMNGLLYVLEADQVLGFDEREWVYDRVLVTSTLRGVTLRGGEAYVYVAKPRWYFDPDKTTREKAALRASYMQMIEEGLAELGPEFRAQYEQSTDPVPTHLLFADRRRASAGRVRIEGGVEPGDPPIKR